MNRKLQTPIFACGVLAAALGLALAAAVPAGSSPDTGAGVGRAHLAQPAALDTAPAPRTRGRRARSALALPYFSVARGAGGRS